MDGTLPRRPDHIDMGRSLRTALAIATLALATTAGAQEGGVRSYWSVRQHDIRSSVNRLSYRLFVSLPPGYVANDTTTYPVLFILDGNSAFPLIEGVRRYLGYGGAMPPVILVGVGYPDASSANTRRTLDLTPSPGGDPASRLPSGGAPAFLETLRRDVIPFIAKRYRARDDRALLGHSYGGLFALYALHTAPELFRRYGIFSPATWWDRRRLLGQLAQGGERRALDARVFVAVGADEDRGMRNEADSVAAVLARVYGAGLTLTNRQYSGNHASYFPEAVSPGLAFLYAAPGCLESLSAGPGRLYAVLNAADGVEIERFVVDGGDVRGRAFRTGGACFSYWLSADAGGKVAGARLEQNLGAPRTASAVLDGGRLRFRATEPAEERAVEVSGPIGFHVPLFVAPLGHLVRMAPSRVGDSTRVLLTNFRRGDTTTGVITRISSDSILVRHPRYEVRVQVSGTLEIVGGTTIPAESAGSATKWQLVRQR